MNRGLWLAAGLLIATGTMAGCATPQITSYRSDPQAFSNPALLRCASRSVPVCDVEGGRTRRLYSNCRCG